MFWKKNKITESEAIKTICDLHTIYEVEDPTPDSDFIKKLKHISTIGKVDNFYEHGHNTIRIKYNCNIIKIIRLSSNNYMTKFNDDFLHNLSDDDEKKIKEIFNNLEKPFIEEYKKEKYENDVKHMKEFLEL